MCFLLYKKDKRHVHKDKISYIWDMLVDYFSIIVLLYALIFFHFQFGCGLIFGLTLIRIFVQDSNLSELRYF